MANKDKPTEPTLAIDPTIEQKETAVADKVNEDAAEAKVKKDKADAKKVQADADRSVDRPKKEVTDQKAVMEKAKKYAKEHGQELKTCLVTGVIIIG